MSTLSSAEPGLGAPPRRRGLWNRKLEHYPGTSKRMVYLAIVVVTTILLYWQLYITGAVATRLLRELDMSFVYFTTALAIGNAIGAFAAILAGLADRWGRANLVTYGVGIAGLITLVGFPLAQTKLAYAVAFSVLGLVEGMILVATPALIRDFSPQLGRASAMGFWTIGPVVGSLMVTLTANASLSHFDSWESQYVICGIVSMVVFVVALFFLRELSPKLRDQLMVASQDRELLELRARTGRVEHDVRHGFRSVLSVRIAASAVGISAFLVIYYTLVAFTVLFFALGFGFSEEQANHLGSWYWGTQVAVLIVVGLLSDRFAVRKPFMLIGAVGSVIATFVLLSRLTNPTSYDEVRWIVMALSCFQGMAFATWMASYTETIEDRHPSLVAHGLAVWGWIIRIIVFALFLIIPHVVHGVSTVADAPHEAELKAHGAALVARKDDLEAKAATLKAQGADLQADVAALKQRAAQAAAAGITPTAAAKKAQADLEARGAALKTEGAELTKQGAALKAEGAAFQASVHELEEAVAEVPRGWRTWMWVCLVGQLIFIPVIFTMRGHWLPRHARDDIKRSAAERERELAELRALVAADEAPAAAARDREPALA
jgi:MFS family permease